MTDAEAKLELESMVRVPVAGQRRRMTAAIAHALLALADRAALVLAWQAGDRLEGGKRDSPALDTARRHMTGQSDDHGTGRRA